MAVRVPSRERDRVTVCDLSSLVWYIIKPYIVYTALSVMRENLPCALCAAWTGWRYEGVIQQYTAHSEGTEWTMCWRGPALPYASLHTFAGFLRAFFVNEHGRDDCRPLRRRTLDLGGHLYAMGSPTSSDSSEFGKFVW